MPGDLVVRWLFGKLPAHGDFIARGIAPDVRDALDAWLTEEMEQARAVWGEAFDRRYDFAPVWHFVDSDGDGWSGGILCASADRVGRKFPLLLAVPASDVHAAAAMSAGCLDLLTTAFAQGWDADRLQAEPVAPVAMAWQPEGPCWALVGEDGPVAQYDGPRPAGVITAMMEMAA